MGSREDTKVGVVRDKICHCAQMTRTQERGVGLIGGGCPVNVQGANDFPVGEYLSVQCPDGRTFVVCGRPTGSKCGIKQNSTCSGHDLRHHG